MANKKVIILNTAITYIRTLFAAAVGLFTARWVLNALGAADYGLYGLVGSILIFITFLNNVLAGSVSRFLAYSIGKKDSEDLNRWFHASLAIHFTIPILLILIGGILGTLAILNWLDIEANMRHSACIVFYISLFAASVPMMLVPFKGLLLAKQDIRIQSLIEIAQSVTHLILMYWLTKIISSHLLIIYASFMAFETICFNAISAWVAKHRYNEIRFTYYGFRFLRPYIKEILSFTTWKSLVGFGNICYNQGQAVVLNLFFGTKLNASYSIASNLSAQSSSISTSMMMAITPEITSREGAGNRDAMKHLSILASKYSAFLISFIALPLFLQIDNLLIVWLKNPPEFTAILCQFILISMLVEKLAIGNESALNACGDIKHFQISIGLSFVIGVFLTYILLLIFKSPAYIGLSMVLCQSIGTVIRVFYGKKIVGISVIDWIKKALIPNMLTILIVAFITINLERIYPEGRWIQLILTTITTSILFIIIGWIFVLDRNIKSVILSKILKR